MAQWIQMAMQGVGSIFTAAGQIREGERENRIAKSEAAQLRQAGTEEYGARTREAYEHAKRTEVMVSNARAAMAGSGGVTTDAQALHQLSEIKRDGDFNVLDTMFKGKAIKADYDRKAAFRQWEGKVAKRAGKNAAIATILSGGYSMMNTYNQNKPPPTDSKGTTGGGENIYPSASGSEYAGMMGWGA